MYGETMLVDQRKELENERAALNAASSRRDQKDGEALQSGRPKRAIRAPRRIDDSSEDMDGESDGASSGNEWSGNEDEPDPEEFEVDGDEDVDDGMSVNDSEMDDAPPEHESLVVQLRYRKAGDSSKLNNRPSDMNGNATAAEDCIIVDPGQPPPETAKETTERAHLNGEASKYGHPHHIDHDGGFVALPTPPNGINSAS